jgi:SpoVK/Ycf46/Vps4 family AAA+-type ATPase
LENRLETPPPQIPCPAWKGFGDYLGEGIKTRLLSLSTLHLTEYGASQCPEAVRKLNSNDNRILLGAAPNCELYQERVVRAVAHQVGARFLVADSSVLQLDDLPPSSKYSADAENGGPLAMTRDGGGLHSGYGTSDDDDEDDLKSLFLGKKGKRSMESNKLRKTAQEALAQVDTERKRLEAASKKLGVDFEEALKKHKLGEEKEVEDVEKEEEEKKEEADGDGKDKEKSVVEEGKVEEEKKEDDQPAAQGDGEADPSSAAAAAAAAAATEDAAFTKESEYIDNIKSLLQFSKESQKTYEDLLETIKEAKKSSSDLAALRGAQRPPLDDRKTYTYPNFISIKAPPGTVGRPSRGRGGRGGGGGRRGRAGSMDFHEMLKESHMDVLRKQPSAEDVFGGKKDTSFKQGDRVCYRGDFGNMPALISSDERERAAGSSLSAYLTTAWLERREATKRKAAAASIAAADAAADASVAAEDGTTPPPSSIGHVLSIDKDGSINLCMDYPFPGGKNFPNQPEKCGFACTAADLSLVDDREDALDASFRALFDVICSQLETTSIPLIVFLPNMDKMIRSQDVDTFRRLKERLISSLPARCLFIGGYCTRSLSKEKSERGPSGLSMLFGGGGSGGAGGGGGSSESLGVGSGDDHPMHWLDRGFLGGPGAGRMRSRGLNKGRLFAAIFPNSVELHPPHNDGAAKAWKKMTDQDIASMREKSNRAALRKALDKCDVVCEDMGAVKITELALSKKELEQVVGAAVAAALISGSGGSIDSADAAMVEEPVAAVETAEAITIDDAAAAAEPPPALDAKKEEDVKKVVLSIKSEHLMAAAASIQCLRAEAAPVPERSALKDLSTDQYERQLLSEVVPPEEIAVGFNDIGALDTIKNTLHEIVILPLQRPELFTRGALTRPTKGLLLFGPPGTGKTMLAKAVASESGAHFININMSAITSKWLGEGERLVRAVFSLAHKLAPCVIFVDEIDSFLGKRGGHSNEHEALRKMKTEFLAGWDGLRTKQTDRVLVLAATNRPMDLDDAAIRRMPRRLFVPLPDASNREKILRTILKDEEVDEKIDFVELGRETDGYSGSDLKNLAIAAAYCPLRELLEVEKKRMSEATAESTAEKTPLPPVRSITMADFTAAMKQVTPSTHAESASTTELQKWNEQFGEGGSRRAEPLVYYT